VDKVHHLVEDAVAHGAVVIAEADIPDGPGYYAAPTVLDHVPADAAIMHEEVFGPVAAIRQFSTEAEAIAAANKTEHGLASYLMSSHIDRARRVAARLQAGMVAGYTIAHAGDDTGNAVLAPVLVYRQDRARFTTSAPVDRAASFAGRASRGPAACHGLLVALVDRRVAPAVGRQAAHASGGVGSGDRVPPAKPGCGAQ
jgi:hypothetical protein